MVKRAGGALLQSITIDRTSSRAIGAQLSSALRDLILGGALKAGERLPATRTLANDLGIARATVIDTFEQLTSEGLLQSRTGAGTFVSQALSMERPIGPVGDARVTTVKQVHVARLMSAATSRFVHRLPHLPRAFTTAMPAFDAFPMAQWARIAAKHWRSPRYGVLGYGEVQGYRPLRQAIAAHLRANRGIACDWQQIFVVAGAQQAFQMVASTLIDPGDRIWFENPGAMGARNSFILYGAELVPVPVDGDGLVVARGLELAPAFRAAFVTPSHQQPLGSKMSLERRFALLQAATAASAWIVEDDWDGEFCFVGRPLPTLKGIDSTGRVIYVGTFSKSLFPSLRLGFLLAPPALVPMFETALEAFSPGVPTSLQAIVSDFIDEGLFATHIRRMRKLYAEKYQILFDAGRQQLSDWLDIQPTSTGLHTIGLLRGGLVGAEVSAAAAARGLTVAPISRFCITPVDVEGLVLGFSGVSPRQITSGVAALAEVLAECAARGAPVRRRARA
ncbi:MAG: PLP-dependent aminotransferase family protein [Alphaproteobacteria bacterium]|nr:PLP-dependent aminotransferase family protein [Alphaproteobacteria bacterium]